MDIKKPQNADTGDVWFPALELDIQKVNDHTHDGSDGAQLAVISQNILSAAWIAAPNCLADITRQFGHHDEAPWLTTPQPWSFRLSSGELIFSVRGKGFQQTTYYVYNFGTISLNL